MKLHLSNRVNYVFYNEYSSHKFVAASAVPEGFNLDPLLIIFINNHLASLTCHALAYGNDLNISSTLLMCLTSVRCGRT